ncbi:diacylglycerol kinase family protein [Aeribacillus alveayuensis]|uniref:Undecaprenol kinase n=1 Tax=Aeribacillus alveayuensis TaxID=279215 RepID=A0ABT9VK09_9BACI|nr:undecaprenol kinase [Bacillus alveayuensis]
MACIDPFKSNGKRFFHSFVFAWQGIISTVKSERNFRIHLLASVLVIIAGIYFRISLLEWIILFLLIGGILALELINTAIECVVDLVMQKKYHPLAKTAKDVGAGAVLVYVIISVIIGILIFIPKLTIHQ